MPPFNLVTLPSEILSNILSYTLPFKRFILHTHPLLTLAATCRGPCAAVEDYTRSLLAQYAQITPQHNEATSLAYRVEWFAWLPSPCYTCGKDVERHAIQHKHSVSCVECNKEVFGDPVSHSSSAILSRSIPKCSHFFFRAEEGLKKHLSSLSTFTQQHQNLHTLSPHKQIPTFAWMFGLDQLDYRTPNPLHPHLPRASGHENIVARLYYIKSRIGTEEADDRPYMNRRSYCLNRLRDYMAIEYRGAGWKLSTKYAEWRSVTLHKEKKRHRYVVERLARWRLEGDEDVWDILPAWWVGVVFGSWCGVERCPCERLKETGEEGNKQEGGEISG